MFDLFRRKQEEKTVTLKLGKAKVIIHTIHGDTYEVPIKGEHDKYSNYYLPVIHVYNSWFLNTKSAFIKVGGGRAIPICNIKEMILTELDEEYSETFPDSGSEF